MHRRGLARPRRWDGRLVMRLAQAAEASSGVPVGWPLAWHAWPGHQARPEEAQEASRGAGGRVTMTVRSCRCSVATPVASSGRPAMWPGGCAGRCGVVRASLRDANGRGGRWSMLFGSAGCGLRPSRSSRTPSERRPWYFGLGAVLASNDRTFGVDGLFGGGLACGCCGGAVAGRATNPR